MNFMHVLQESPPESKGRSGYRRRRRDLAQFNHQDSAKGLNRLDR